MSECPIESPAEVVVNLNEKTPIRVLHVDDELNLLKIAKQCLEMDYHFQVDTALSVDEAMEKIKKKTYDVIVSDYQMPGKDGLEFLKELKKKGNTTPFVIFTGKGREEVAIKALNLGADRYLNKFGEPETVYAELAHGMSQVVEKRRASDALRESKNKARTLLENIPQKIFFKDRNSVYISCNGNYTRNLGIKVDQIEGKTDFDFFPKELAEKYRADDKRIMKSGTTEDIDEEYVQDGQKTYVHTVKTPVKDEKGNVIGVLGIFWDITERKKSEQELFDKRTRLQNIFDVSPDAILVIDLNGKIVDCNDQAQKMLGYSSKSEAVGRSALEPIAEKDRQRAIENMERTLKQGLMRNIEYNVLAKDGSERLLSVSASVLKDFFANPTGFVSVIQDVTERKNTEDALTKSERKYREFADSLPEIAFEIDEKGNVTFFNQRASEILGYSQEDFRSTGIFQFLIPKDRARARENIQKILEGEKSPGNEYTLLRKDGSTFPVIAFTSRIVCKDGKGGVRGVIVDISEQKNAEKKLRESEEKFRNLAEQSPNMIFINRKGSIVYANKEAEDVMGYEKEEFYSPDFNFHDLIAQESKESVKSAFSKHTKSENVAPYEYRLITREGRIIDAILTTRLITYEGETAILGTVIDITQRKKLERELFDKQMKLQNIFAASPDAILVTDLNGNLIDCNQAALILYGGLSKDDLMGKNAFDLIANKDQHRAIEEMKEMIRNKNQEPSKDAQYNVITKDGRELLAELSSSVVKDSSGNPVAFVAIVRDITERKKAEEVLKESEEKYRNLFENANTVIITCDLKGNVTSVNKTAQEYGFEKDEIIGKNMLRFVPEKYWPRLIAQLAQIAMGNSVKGEIEIITPLGKRNAEHSSSPIRVAEKVIGFQTILRDTTESKRYEERLSALSVHSQRLSAAESMEEIYRLTMDAIEKTLGFEIAFFMVAERGMLRVVDHRGYPESFSTELPLNGSKKGVSIKAFRTRKSVNVPDAEKEDEWVEFMPGIQSAIDVPVKIGNKVLGVIGVDSKELNAFSEKDQELVEILASHAATAISNLDRAKKLETSARETRESQQRFERLFMDNPEATVHLDSSFHILNVNQRFIRLFGYSLDEIKGKHINDVVVQKGKMKEAEMLDKKAIKGYVYHDTVRRRKDGSPVPVSISAAPVIVESRLLGFVGMYKDISELKNAEKKLESVNEKLQVVGGLTRHDVRNKLSTITGNIYLNKKKMVDHPEILATFKDMESACEQIVRIFDFAKDYERLGVEELKYVDVEKVVGEAFSLFPDLRGVEITNSCHGLTVLADSLFRQLFYNLIDNSLRYGEKLSQITIRYEKANGNQLRLVYEDDGVGIAWDAKPKIFREGYTTGKGSGYGLYLVKRMMEVYGWDIRETGTPGKGAYFTVAIPEANQYGKKNYQLR